MLKQWKTVVKTIVVSLKPIAQTKQVVPVVVLDVVVAVVIIVTRQAEAEVVAVGVVVIKMVVGVAPVVAVSANQAIFSMAEDTPPAYGKGSHVRSVNMSQVFVINAQQRDPSVKLIPLLTPIPQPKLFVSRPTLLQQVVPA